MKGSQNNREIRVEDYYRWVISVADEQYWRLVKKGISGVERDDLIQTGLVGLLEAKRNFDQRRNVKFITYASIRVKGVILDFLRSLDWLSQRKREKLKEYGQIKEELLQEFGREPILGEIAKRLGISEEETRERERWQLFFVSLEEPCFTDDETGLYQQLSSPGPDPEEESMRKELAKDTDLCLKRLSLEEERIIIQRKLEERPLREVASSLKMTISKTQRWEKEAERKLKDCLEKRGWSVKKDLTGSRPL